MIAAIMCGGMATRMAAKEEKPLLKIDGMPIVERVLIALQASRSFDRIVAAVSPKVPRTRAFLESKAIEIVETAGEGYSQDLSRLLDQLRGTRVFVTPADMPLLTPEVINSIAARAQKEPAATVILEKEFVQRIGIAPSVIVTYAGRDYCHSGITIFDTSKITEGILNEECVIMNRMELAVNVNTKGELELAEKLLIQRA